MSTKQPRVLLPLMNDKKICHGRLVQTQKHFQKNSSFHDNEFLSDNKPHVQRL